MLPARSGAIVGRGAPDNPPLFPGRAGRKKIPAGGFLVANPDLPRLDDKELTRLRRDRVGFIFQAYNLVPTLTAIENITLPMMLAGRKGDQAWVDRVVDVMGLRERLHHRPAELSGGQQQRAAIARALAMDPKLMLFDEPTSALDPEMIKEVLDVMVELAHEGTTMIVVSHEMGFARSAASQVVFMDRGRIVESAPPEQFFSAPRSERAREFLSKVLAH